MAGDMQVITAKWATLRVISPINSFGTERKFEKDLTIAQLKYKIEILCGASPRSMKLALHSEHNKFVCNLDNDDAMLGSYPVEDGMIVQVEDSSLELGEFEDVSKVEKFELTSDEYEKRADTVLAFKQRNKLGRFNAEDKAAQDEEMRVKNETNKTKAESISVGDRCEVKISGQGARRGTVRYVGLTEFKPGHWVGVQYDEPTGKNDGSVGGKRYFECTAKYGGFVKPQDVEVGDFPEEDFGFDDDDEM